MLVANYVRSCTRQRNACSLNANATFIGLGLESCFHHHTEPHGVNCRLTAPMSHEPLLAADLYSSTGQRQGADLSLCILALLHLEA